MKTHFVSGVKYSLAIMVAVVIIVGCGAKPSTIPVQPPVKEKPVEGSSLAAQKNPQAGIERHGHERHALVKPGAAVSLKNPEPFFAAVPGTYEYPLALLSSVREGKMIVDVSTSEGLAIVSSVQHFEFALHERGDYSLPLVIKASKEGRFYIQLQVSVIIGEQRSARALAAIVQVGEPAVKANKAAPNGTGPEAESVISLPAQETISPR